nr:MAG TPA: hypothetical protein [Bacteriophage sp.]
MLLQKYVIVQASCLLGDTEVRQESQMPCIYKLISFYPIQPNEEKELTLLLFVAARPAAKPHRFCCRHIQIPERRCNYGFNFYYRNVYPPCGYSLSHHRLHHEEMDFRRR